MNFDVKQLQKVAQRAQQQMGGGGGLGRGLGAFGGIIGFGLLGLGLYESMFTVQGGHRAVMFSRLSGVTNNVYGEGTHLRIPWLEWPTIYDIRTKPKIIRSPTGTKDLQMVDISLRILYKPQAEQLPSIHRQLGTNFDERVLPSIANETLKSVIAQFNASQLITQREQVSGRIKQQLTDRAKNFNIIIDDVSITHLTFGAEYTAAVEAKQIAQQDAERARYLVKQAIQDKKSTIIKAQGEAKSAEMIGDALKKNPGYIELRQLDAARDISSTMANSQNKVFLDSSSLLLNVLELSGSGKRLSDDKNATPLRSRAVSTQAGQDKRRGKQKESSCSLGSSGCRVGQL